MPILLRRIRLWKMPENRLALAGDSERNLAAKALHSVLFGTLWFSVLFLALVVPFFVARKAAAGASLGAAVVVTLTCILLLSRGYARLSSWIFLSSAWLFLAVFVALSGGIRSPLLLSHIAVVVLSAWLLDRRAAIRIAALSLFFILSMTVMESIGVSLPRYFPLPPIVAWVMAAGLISLAIMPLATVNQALADSAKQAQRELEARLNEEQGRAESDDRFRAAFFQAAVGIVQVGLDGKWLLINDRYCQMLGYTMAELYEKTFQEITHPDDLGDVLAGRLRLLAGEISFHTMDKRFLRKDGTIFWASLYRSVVRDQQGQPKYIIAVVEDINERKQAEAALRESEERFRNMADAAAVMVWVSGTDKLCNFFNRPWLNFTGRTMEQELGNGWAEGVHPADSDHYLAIYNSSFAARRAFQMEYRLRRADGEYRWVLDNGTPLYRENEFAGFIGSCVDITEQKRIEERLRANEVQLVDAQRLANVGSWVRDLDTERIHWSDEIFRIFGLPNDGLPDRQAFLRRVHPKDREIILEAGEKACASPIPVDVEYRVVRPDGEIRFVHSIAEAIRNDRGVPVRIVGATQDITEQVKARELLREREERLKSAERLVHVGYWHRDLESNQVVWSEGCCRIFGQPRDYTPTYESFLQAVVPQDRERMERWTRDRSADRSGNTTEFRIARPDGDVRTVLSVSDVLRDEDGLPVRVFGALQDVTEERRAREESFARQKLESVGTLASGIAHDFNNLLGSVLVQAELALSELSTGSNPEGELKAIRDVAIHGSEIVRELMIYAGKESAVIGPVEVSRIVGEMLELLKVSVSKHAVLEADLAPDLPAVRANAAQLRQIVMNLVTNASEAIGDRDGVIRVTTRRLKSGQDSSGWISDRLADGDHLQLEVSDTGRGIPLEMQAKVFDPFFTTKSAGHGLGLAIVLGLVRGLGGAIHLRSEPDKGTTLQILLPCAEPRAEATGDAMPGIEKSVRPSEEASVLVVEDEGALRQGVAKTLRNTGFEVFEAADGSSAIDLLRARGAMIDAVLLDMTIPGAPSREVVAEAARVQPDIRVILTSAYSHEMIAGSIDAPQIRGFVRKPFQLGDLVKTLRNALAAPASGNV
ncbi:MAG TPA: PAS domain S-box protein [Bryobacteraceae bacterium]|nr:PAS domain S-box protein [Bryobacteraceae bacterium]